MGLTLPSSNYIKAKVKWLWMVVKIPISLAFSKLVLDVKVKFLLISWHLSNQYFLQQKKKRKSTYIPKILSFWLHHRVSSTKIWLLAYSLLISVISSWSDRKKKLIFLGSQMAPSTKIRKFKSSKVYQATKWISIKAKRNTFVLVTSSDNKYQRNCRFLDSFLHKIFESFCP